MINYLLLIFGYVIDVHDTDMWIYLFLMNVTFLWIQQHFKIYFLIGHCSFNLSPKYPHP